MQGEDFICADVLRSTILITFEKNITRNDQREFFLKLQGLEQAWDDFDKNMVHF